MVHDAVFVELPVFVSIGAVPVAGVVVALVGKTNGDAGSIEGPKFLDEAVVELAAPLSGEELDDLFAAVDKLRAVSPLAIYRIDESDLFGVAGVPSVFRFADLCGCGFASERRDQAQLRWRRHFFSLCSFGYFFTRPGCWIRLTSVRLHEFSRFRDCSFVLCVICDGVLARPDGLRGPWLRWKRPEGIGRGQPQW